MNELINEYNKELDNVIDSLGEVEEFELVLNNKIFHFKINLKGCLKIEEEKGMTLEEIFINIFNNVEGVNYLDFLIEILPYFCKEYITKEYLLESIPLNKRYLQLLDAIFLCIGGIVDSTDTYRMIYKKKLIEEMNGGDK